MTARAHERAAVPSPAAPAHEVRGWTERCRFGAGRACWRGMGARSALSSLRADGFGARLPDPPARRGFGRLGAGQLSCRISAIGSLEQSTSIPSLVVLDHRAHRGQALAPAEATGAPGTLAERADRR